MHIGKGVTLIFWGGIALLLGFSIGFWVHRLWFRLGGMGYKSWTGPVVS